MEGVTYYNDSKGTNVDSTIKAVLSMKAPTVMILGGYDKHPDFSPLCEEIVASGMISQVVLIGETAAQIADSLLAAGFARITMADGMEVAIQKARQLAVSGGNVLLSPACASLICSVILSTADRCSRTSYARCPDACGGVEPCQLLP